MKNQYNTPFRVAINVDGVHHDVRIEAPVDTTAYENGDVLFASVIAIPDVARSSGRNVRLDSVIGAEDGGQAPSMTLLFFHVLPSQTGAANAAVAWAGNHARKFAGKINIVAADWETLGSKSFLTLGGMQTDLTVTGTDLYMVAVCKSAYDAVAVGDLSLTLNFNREA